MIEKIGKSSNIYCFVSKQLFRKAKTIRFQLKTPDR